MRIAIIPARGGSVRIPRKNIREFFGKPIIAYSIDRARLTGLFDEIYVSTEDAEIAEVARRYGAKVVDRPADLAELGGAPDCGTQEVTRHAILALRDRGISCDYACCIYPTAPLMTADDLWGGFHCLTGTPPYDFVFPIGGKPLQDAGQWYWGTARAFLERRPLKIVGGSCFTWMLPPQRVCDINTEADWERALATYEKLFIQPKARAHRVMPQIEI